MGTAIPHSSLSLSTGVGVSNRWTGIWNGECTHRLTCVIGAV